MNETKEHHLPLLRPKPPPTTADSAIINTRTDSKTLTLRLAFIAFVSLVSLWANHEASKGFSITIVNDAGDTSAGKRFGLFYVSNDRATRLVLDRSTFVENILYPSKNICPDRPDSSSGRGKSRDMHNCLQKKYIHHVILRLSGQNQTSPVEVTGSGELGVFEVHLSPSIMEEKNHKHAMFGAVQRGMTRVWMWDGQGNAPNSLVNGIVEYIVSLSVSGGPTMSSGGARLPEYSGSGCWKGDMDPVEVSKLLNYCEGKSEGFVRRLNQEMRNDWHEGILNDALLLGGVP